MERSEILRVLEACEFFKGLRPNQVERVDVSFIGNGTNVELVPD